MSDQEIEGTVGKEQGRLAKWGSSVKKSVDDAQAVRKERLAQNLATYGTPTMSKVFGGSTVEIYDGGYVRVSPLMTGKTPFEKLRSIEYSFQVQDKSAGGRAVAGAMVMGVNYLGSKEKRFAFLTIATGAKVHTLKTKAGMTRTEDRIGMALEAAGNAVLDTVKSATPMQVTLAGSTPSETQPDLADQIKKLAELHASGILTDEEFTNKKAVLLERM
ncbi:hypothetical protein C6I20_14445 [Aeromicrobium sp. A1-2]|uniref:SHOCT domain-containing protein n=1 Tax=Aeromicrobium sp. A1-2 TaxID=2107713 RepID=UPI000E4AA66F|nr:SHOCT domain-containing protein [Aeromicrobium sp. A1-2]AXT86262.1 hypothetical protein C6I20_14445 [Aeromicrobium sp. A1-2]